MFFLLNFSSYKDLSDSSCSSCSFSLGKYFAVANSGTSTRKAPTVVAVNIPTAAAVVVATAASIAAALL